MQKASRNKEGYFNKLDADSGPDQRDTSECAPIGVVSENGTDRNILLGWWEDMVKTRF